jgi:MscS family membrane protein
MISELLRQLRAVPEYFIALKASLAVLVSGLPLYLGLRYFLYRRKLAISFWVSLNFVSVFILFAGLAFLLASPLASYFPPAAISAYLFLTCIAASISVVSLIDVFVLQHYFTNVKKLYVSPPLRMVIKMGVFCLAILPIFRFVLHFDPLTLIAIPTIATAGLALALQDTLKSFIAGVGLGHVIRIGEWISFQDKEGRVIDINWARTLIETADGQRVFIPNALLQAGIFLNYSTGNPLNRQCFKISAAYDAAPARVKETLLKSIQGVSGIEKTPEPQAFLQEYAESGINYGLFYWVEDYTSRLRIQDQIATSVWNAFKQDGISIPYPTRTVQLQRPSDLDSAH